MRTLTVDATHSRPAWVNALPCRPVWKTGTAVRRRCNDEGRTVSHCGRGGPTASPSGDGGCHEAIRLSALLTGSAAITFSALISRGPQEDLAGKAHPVIMPAHG